MDSEARHWLDSRNQAESICSRHVNPEIRQSPGTVADADAIVNEATVAARRVAAASPKIQQIFERHRDRPWVFLRPLGNWGDHLIFVGAERMADALGLQWTSCETPEFQALSTTPEHCIYLQGGGGYNSWCSGRAFVNLELALARPVHLVVQGPVSFGGSHEWLAKRLQSALSCIDCRDWLFFAREEVTYGLLHELALPNYGAQPCLDHDTALALTPGDLLDIAGLESMPQGNYDLVVLREDNEMPGSTGSLGAVTRGLVAEGISLDPAFVANTFGHWVRIHLHARTITTNRLHSAVIGAAAGKRVFIGPGSYHKNKSVCQYSLASRGVQWVDAIEPPAAPLWNLLPPRIKGSYKVGRLRLALHGVPLR